MKNIFFSFFRHFRSMMLTEIILFSNVRKCGHYTAALIMLKCHFSVMASNELTSVREVIISAEERP
jgi:hypothetical protein